MDAGALAAKLIGCARYVACPNLAVYVTYPDDCIMVSLSFNCSHGRTISTTCSWAREL